MAMWTYASCNSNWGDVWAGREELMELWKEWEILGYFI